MHLLDNPSTKTVDAWDDFDSRIRIGMDLIYDVLEINMLRFKSKKMKIIILSVAAFVIIFFSMDFNKITKSKKVISIENKKTNIKQPANWPWRGINIISSDTIGLNRKKIQGLKKMGINTVRLSIHVRQFSDKNNLSIETAEKLNLNWCENIVKWCAEESIDVILNSIDFPLNPVKKFDRTSSKFWSSENELNDAISYIEKLIIRFDGYDNVIAYDFFGEPVEKVVGGKDKVPKNWINFFRRILKTIRSHSNKYVVFTPGPWGSPKGYSDFLKPFEDNNIIYGFHYYKPHKYTHQGIKKYPENINYPGLIGNKYWNKNTIQKSMLDANNWAQKNDKLLYVGEFSVVRRAKGKDQYIEDVLASFEENNMSYTYWCLNGWDGWNMNFDQEKEGEKKIAKSTEITKTREILEKYWAKNKVNK